MLQLYPAMGAAFASHALCVGLAVVTGYMIIAGRHNDTASEMQVARLTLVIALVLALGRVLSYDSLHTYNTTVPVPLPPMTPRADISTVTLLALAALNAQILLGRRWRGAAWLNLAVSMTLFSGGALQVASLWIPNVPLTTNLMQAMCPLAISILALGTGWRLGTAPLFSRQRSRAALGVSTCMLALLCTAVIFQRASMWPLLHWIPVQSAMLLIIFHAAYRRLEHRLTISAAPPYRPVRDTLRAQPFHLWLVLRIFSVSTALTIASQTVPLPGWSGATIWLVLPYLMVELFALPITKAAYAVLAAVIGIWLGLVCCTQSVALAPAQLGYATLDVAIALLLAMIQRQISTPPKYQHDSLPAPQDLDRMLVMIAVSLTTVMTAGLLTSPLAQASTAMRHIPSLRDIPWPDFIAWCTPRLLALFMFYTLSAAITVIRKGGTAAPQLQRGVTMRSVAVAGVVIIIGAICGAQIGQTAAPHPLLGIPLFLVLAGTVWMVPPVCAALITCAGILAALACADLSIAAPVPLSLSLLLMAAAFCQSVAALLHHNVTLDRHLRKLVFEDTHAMQILLDRDLNVLRLNTALRQYLGVNRLPRAVPLSALSNLAVRPSTVRHLRNRATPDHSTTQVFSVLATCRDGTQRQCEVQLRPTQTADNVPLMVGEVIDIEDRTALRSFVKNACNHDPNISLIVTQSEGVLYVSPILAQDLGQSETDIMGTTLSDLFDKDAQQYFYSLVTQDGQNDTDPNAAPAVPIQLKGVTFLANARVTQSKGSQQAIVTFNLLSVSRLMSEQEMNRLLLKEGPAIILSQDRLGQIQSASDAWSARFGYSTRETLNHPFTTFIAPDQHDLFAQMIERCMRGKRSTGMFTLTTRAGNERQIEASCVVQEQGGNWRILLAITDVSDLVIARQALQDQLDLDDLTRLNSRRAMNRRLSQLGQEPGWAVLVLDIDFFKSVNDIHGHATGDALLSLLGPVLTKIAGPSAFCARVGGEEFVILHPNMTWEKARNLAEALRGGISNTRLSTGMGDVGRTASVGVALTRNTLCAERAIVSADRALQVAKTQGRNRCILANHDFIRRQWENGSMISVEEVIRAIRAGEFQCYLQPIRNAQDQYIAGFEALIRWIRPKARIMPTHLFLKQLLTAMEDPDCHARILAMQVDVIRSLTSHPGGFISFNTRLEALAFQGAAATLDPLQDAARETGRTVVLEITEGTSSERLDMEQVRTEMTALRRKGFLLALDDFGKEASNLTRLINMPIDIVKIDKELLAQVETDRRPREALRAICQMCGNLGISVIAEGIERQGQHDFAKSLGVTYVQGFLLGYPASLTTIAQDSPQPAD
ncbi:hypothetical protein BFP70_16190 [Thioclava sp. SK-1]|nr:hypothetical protein BFP70_16190 [Thioclava sp. SK-1]